MLFTPVYDTFYVFHTYEGVLSINSFILIFNTLPPTDIRGEK